MVLMSKRASFHTADTCQVTIALPRYVAYHPIGCALDDYLTGRSLVASKCSMRHYADENCGDDIKEDQIIYTVSRNNNEEKKRQNKARGSDERTYNTLC